MNKSNEERLIISRFIQTYPSFPKGKLIKSESPDFILKLNHKKSIGIELTKLFMNQESGDPRDPGFLANLITSCLRKKEEKLVLYQKKRIDYYWLIILIDPLMIWWSETTVNRLFDWQPDTSFHKVFLFGMMEGKMVELK
jgi:hypothetical protein